MSILRESCHSPSHQASFTPGKKLLGDGANERAVGEGERGAPEEASPAQMADEIRRLRKELSKSQRREDILKKAALILGNDPRNDMS